jgi:glycosyltransferase involved in cell wall biosynthesis
MHLSIIIPTLSRPQTAALLAMRVRDLLPEVQIEAIVVLPPDVPRPPDSGAVTFINDGRRGVYMAYRAGLEHATGEYCWFMGDDDYPLDGLAQMRAPILASRDDVLVAPVLFSTGRIYRPTRSLFLLQFLNWCQQGVIYRRSLLSQHRFFRRLVVQADQYVNLLLRANPTVRTEFFPKPICVFGVEGVSGRLRDTHYAALRVALARRTLSRGSFLLFRALMLVEPLVKQLVRLR